MTKHEPFAYLDQFRHKVTGDFLDGISIGGVRLIMGGSRELDKIADMINAAHEARVKEEVKKAVEKFRERAAKIAHGYCECVNGFDEGCPAVLAIYALPTEPEGK